jgi:hypothetical protein
MELVLLPKTLWQKPLLWYGAVLIAIPLGVFADANLGLSQAGQWLLAVPLWWIVVCSSLNLTKKEATILFFFIPIIVAVEYVLSHKLGWYHYRLQNIPAWIPPAHGIIFLTGIRLMRTNRPKTTSLVVLAIITQLSYGLTTLVRNNDKLGFVMSFIFVGGLLLLPKPAKRFYVGVGLAVAYLELVGVALGGWAWSNNAFGLHEANPPAGAVTGYLFVDGIAFIIASLAIYLSTKKSL